MNIRRNVRLWSAAAVFGAALAGCESPKSPSGSADRPAVTAPRYGHEPLPPQLATNSERGKPESASTAETSVPSAANEPKQAPSPGTAPADKKVETSSDAKPPASKAEANAVEPYDAKKPMLMGIRLTDTKPTVVQKFGEPASDYVMEDERDPISVSEYEGFSVGFDSTQHVEFIEITSRDVNPGLNGLRLGQKVKDAEAALGKPDTNTSYALHYRAGGTILKLDIDPKTETIQSIKLFADRK